MRKVLIFAFGLALVGTSAWSQSSSRDDNGNHRDHWHDDYDRWDTDQDDRRGRTIHDGEERLGRNARFYVRNGDTQLRVVCGDQESTQACVDAVLKIFDRVQSQPRATTNSPSTLPQ